MRECARNAEAAMLALWMHPELRSRGEVVALRASAGPRNTDEKPS